MNGITRRQLLAAASGAAFLQPVTAAGDPLAQPGPNPAPPSEPLFKPEWSSLKQFQVPDWFRDAKLGILLHWSIDSVPAYATDLYAHYMYLDPQDLPAVLQGTNLGGIFERHRRIYGDQGVFGYKDFIPQFRGERFDANALAAQFQQWGARYVVALADGADGFAMYPSNRTPWNAARMGPRRDVIGELAHAVRQRGMKFGVASERAAAWSCYTYRPGYDTMNPAYAGLYGMPHDPNAPPDAAFIEDHYQRTVELIDRYHPDLLGFGEEIAIPEYESFRLRIAAYYFNQAAAWRSGGVVLNYSGSAYPAEAGVINRTDYVFTPIRERPWQSLESFTGSWGYQKPVNCRPKADLIRETMAVVCKNGSLMLQVAPDPSGSLPASVREAGDGLGAWLRVNGGGIYGTRPYVVLGEGQAMSGRGRSNAPIPVHYTVSRDALNAIVMDWLPASTPLTLEKVVVKRAGPGARVVLLGSSEKVPFVVHGDRLSFRFPLRQPTSGGPGWVFQLIGFELGVPELAAAPLNDGSYSLIPRTAVRLSGSYVDMTEGDEGDDRISGWRENELAEWRVRFPAAVRCKILLRCTCGDPHGSQLRVRWQQTDLPINIPAGGSWSEQDMLYVEGGQIDVPAPAIDSFTVHTPMSPDAWRPVDLYEVRLLPV